VEGEGEIRSAREEEAESGAGEGNDDGEAEGEERVEGTWSLAVDCPASPVQSSSQAKQSKRADMQRARQQASRAGQSVGLRTGGVSVGWWLAGVVGQSAAGQFRDISCTVLYMHQAGLLSFFVERN
jgi:hypothetical protein